MTKPVDGTRAKMVAFFDGERFIILACPDLEGLREFVEAWRATPVHQHSPFHQHTPSHRGLWILTVSYMSQFMSTAPRWFPPAWTRPTARELVDIAEGVGVAASP